MNNDLSGALDIISKVIFTNRCKLCGEVVELDDDHCEDCLKPPLIKSPRCDVCGVSKEDCNCKKHKNEFNSVVAPFYYEGSIIKAVNRCKNYNMPFLTEEFSKHIAATVTEEFKDIKFDYITFVPMRKYAQRKRGFNQAQLIADALSDKLNIECKPLLVKIERTKAQKEQTARERKVNLFGAFDVSDKRLVKGKTILLVDDVKTTGSTLNECSKMLKIYGASAVYCATFAIVNNENKR